MLPRDGMIRLVLRRVMVLVPVAWLVVTLTFVVVHLAPGSYADQIAHARHSPEARELLRQRYGLDRPVAEQYAAWLRSVVTGDLGTSFVYRRPVARVLGDALPPTLLLAGTALVMNLVLGLVLAMAALRRPHGWLDRILSLLGLGLYGLPSFWVAGVLVLVFSLLAGWLPPSHMRSVGADALPAGARLLDLLQHLALPAATLGLVGAAATGRYLRAALLDLRDAPFITAARARGLSERRIRWAHVLRPALLPVITLLGLSLPMLVSGSLVVEVVFAWPGMGRVLWTAAMARDVPVILAATLVGCAAVLLGNLLADLMYAVVDPRTREMT